jgi:hypothetical protein
LEIDREVIDVAWLVDYAMDVLLQRYQRSSRCGIIRLLLVRLLSDRANGESGAKRRDECETEVPTHHETNLFARIATDHHSPELNVH